jgi:hypothetical protein
VLAVWVKKEDFLWKASLESCSAGRRDFQMMGLGAKMIARKIVKMTLDDAGVMYP